MRHRHALYLSDSLTQALVLAAETHRVPKSAILELALQKFLAPSSNGSSDNLGHLQHNANLRSLALLRHELAIVSELLATLIRFFVTATPRMPLDEQAAAQILGNPRFDQMVDEVSARLRTDASWMAQIRMRLGETGQKTASDHLRRDNEHATAASQSVSSGSAQGDGDG